MCDVIDLAARRAAAQAPKPAAHPTSNPAPVKRASMPESEHYFCIKCDSDQFRLYAAGEVHCAKCGSLMQNLCVGESGK